MIVLDIVLQFTSKTNGLVLESLPNYSFSIFSSCFFFFFLLYRCTFTTKIFSFIYKDLKKVCIIWNISKKYISLFVIVTQNMIIIYERINVQICLFDIARTILWYTRNVDKEFRMRLSFKYIFSTYVIISHVTSRF